MIEILTGQLTDVFRLGLLIALVLTARRTAAATGWWLPLAFGVLFVAIIIPVTTPEQTAEPIWRLALVGVLANLIMLALVLAVWSLVERFRK